MAKQYRLYCAVFGCLNSTITHPDMTFFKLPSISERRFEWLQLIGRDDLENKSNYLAYRICEKHFNADYIHVSPNRKLLKRNAVPSLLLPSNVLKVSYKEDKQTQCSLLTPGVDKFTQTDIVRNESYAQTSTTISCNTLRIRKLKAKLQKYRKKIKLLETKNKT